MKQSGVHKKAFAFPAALKACGVLGINRRNAEYILPLNFRELYPRVDDKLITKSLCLQHQIPVPETYFSLSKHGEITGMRTRLLPLSEFVIKPACGSGGRGVLVIAENRGDSFLASDNSELDYAEIRYHVSTILSGLYSLGGQPDRAIIESRIRPHEVFKQIAVQGTPDVRVIVYKGVPVMAMLRLPTAMSKGRANLHQGAIAAGIVLQTGITCGGVWNNKAIDIHPETGASIVGVTIPHWQTILETSARLFDVLELQYFGVDFVLDSLRGPTILEANARPGLAIQIANRDGLLNRLKAVDKIQPAGKNSRERLALLPILVGTL